MTTLALDANNNFVDGQTLQLLDGCEETAQNARLCLTLFPSESCVFPEAGIDWFSPVMRSETFARTILTTKLAGIEGVDAVNSIDFQITDRFAKITANITASGETVFISTPSVPTGNLPPVPNPIREIVCIPNLPPVPNAVTEITCMPDGSPIPNPITVIECEA